MTEPIDISWDFGDYHEVDGELLWDKIKIKEFSWAFLKL